MLKQDEERLNIVVKKLSQLPYVSVIILFGSQATGKQRFDSDIDIAVITKKISKNQELELLGYGNEKIEISLFENLPLMVQFRVIRDGKMLVMKDEKKFHDIKYKIIKKYLDFSYYMNNFYRSVIKNV